jgi:TonB family protein
MILSREILASQDRFRKALVVSVGVHALLLAWLLLHETIAPHDQGIVEITWLEELAAPAAPAPAAIVPEVETALKPTPQPKPEKKFLRREETAPVKPVPQITTANQDRVKQRLENMRSTAVAQALTVAPPTTNNLLAAQAPPQATVPKGEGAELRRDQIRSTAPRALTRGTAPTSNTKTPLATVKTEVPLEPAAAPDLDAAARRSLAGADLMGEVADRPIVSHVMPVYPEWAKDQAVEGTVTLRFYVLPDGRVKENIQVERTAGFADFDNNAVRALAQWRFAPLSGGASVEQWGSITFRYRLRG